VAFSEKAAGLGACCPPIEDEAGAVAHLRALAGRDRWCRLAAHGERPAALAASVGLPVLRTDGGYDPVELERVDASVTGCDALVAQTGSVVLSAASAGGRGLSILPPHHVVVARRDQLVADLPAAISLLQSRYGGGWPSLVSFVTGPSRTGDIERILVLGAHGPKQLTILVC
jgi:L-lactate dehydrogenase complex protein LldG